MAIKNWTKKTITHQPKPKHISWIEGIWKNNKTELIIKKTGTRYEYIRNFYGVGQASKTFSNRAEAIKYAIKYMKAHPRG